MKLDVERSQNEENINKEKTSRERDYSESGLINAIQSHILNSPTRLEREIKTTGNSWLASFSSDLSLVNGWFEVLIAHHPELKKKYQESNERIQSLITRFEELRKEYKGKEVPQEIKQELSSKLDIFKQN